ncbi:MAG: glycosyltransferase [Candidatus Aminicenantales bacterium]
MISVIIPTFNRAAFLGDAITSVLEQDYFRRAGQGHRFELLVVDDGSEDKTREVVESFGGRAAFLSQPHRGVSAARNLGLRSARGEFIAFLDSDDLWEKEKIGAQMGYFKAFPDAKVCYTEELWLRRGKHLNPHRKHQKHSGWIFGRVLSLCLLSLSSCLFRSEIFEEVGIFDESLPVCEDYDLGIRLAHRFPVHLIPRPLIIKRGGHPDQLSRRYWGMDRFRVLALEKALRLDLAPGEERLVREELVRKCRILSQGFSRRGNLAEADRYRALLLRYGGGRDAEPQNQ